MISALTGWWCLVFFLLWGSTCNDKFQRHSLPQVFICVSQPLARVVLSFLAIAWFKRPTSDPALPLLIFAGVALRSPLFSIRSFSIFVITQDQHHTPEETLFPLPYYLSPFLDYLPTYSSIPIPVFIIAAFSKSIADRRAFIYLLFIRSIKDWMNEWMTRVRGRDG